MGVSKHFWRLRFARWAPRPRTLSPGHTLLIPVPGDLPVFLELALAVCRRQTHRTRRAALVIPDYPSDAVRAVVDRERASWPGGGLELLELPLVDRLVLPRLGDPGRNHGAQLVAGAAAARTERVVLHDADLFLFDDGFHDRLVEEADAEDLDVIGVDRAWDPWYAARGRELVATWEQCSRTDWLRRFPPHRHIGHEAVVDGEAHVFDTTFWPQLQTPRERIGLLERRGEPIVHFNYVISTYRKFQKSYGAFSDRNFRLLLVRLLVDLFDRQGHGYELPSLDELAEGLEGRGRVRYDLSDTERYADFRRQISRVLDGPWTERNRASRARELLDAFDVRYGYTER